MNTHPEQWAAIYAAAPGEQLGVRCLAQGHLSRGIAGPRLEPTTLGNLCSYRKFQKEKVHFKYADDALE